MTWNFDWQSLVDSVVHTLHILLETLKLGLGF